MGVRTPGFGIPVTWVNLSGKPATFPPSVHTHGWTDITGKPATYTPSPHTHPISDIVGLDAALASKQPVGSYAAAAHTHIIGDVTGLQSALDGKAAAVHAHIIGDVTGLQTALNGKAALAHNHPISEVVGLQASLDGKQATGNYVTNANFTWANLSGKPTTFAPSAHTHAIADVTGLQAALDAKPVLGSSVPKLALGTGSAGAATVASREDHVHPIPPGILQFIGTLIIGESALITLNLAVRRYTAALAGLSTSDRVAAFLNGTPQNGSLQDVYVSATNTLNVGVLTPALGVASTVSVPISVYRVST